MQLGDQSGVHVERSPLDVALDEAQQALWKMIGLLEDGGLDQLIAEEKISWWQRFETFRNQLPLIDHHLIATAEATDLAGSYGFTNLSRFLVRILQLSPGEAASRVRAAAAIGPRTSMLGEHLAPVLPRLAERQREGSVSVEKVQIVERAMHKLSRSGIDPEAVQTAEQLLTDYAPLLGPADLHRYAPGLWMRPIRMGRNQLMINSNTTAGSWNSSSAAMACGGCRANSPAPWVPSSTPSSTRSASRAAAASKTKPALLPRLRIRGPTCNGCTTGWMRSAAECCRWATGRSPAAPRHQSSSPLV